jgi:hypothetical protein
LFFFKKCSIIINNSPIILFLNILQKWFITMTISLKIYISRLSAVIFLILILNFILLSQLNPKNFTNTTSLLGNYGNYWDDYIGNDTYDDGISDTPYSIPPNGMDDHPLMPFSYVGDIQSLPDLLIYNYTLTNSTLEITIKNIGETAAANIAFLVEFESIELILYNNTLTHLNLAPNENFTFFIWLVPFSEYFELNSSYLIHVSIDPQNLIEEQNELNNEVDIPFTYHGFGDNEPPPFIFIISGYPLFIYPIVLLAICIPILRVLKRKQ